MLNKFCEIIGTKKGATSSLYEYIKQHPALVGGFKKEPNFFGNIKNWGKGLDWYQEQFVGYDASSHVYGLDGTTDYTQEGFLDIPKRMKESEYKFKFIYILRDPIDKIESQTHQFLIDGDSIRPIYECLDCRIVESANYYKQLKRYLECFSKDQILLVDFKRLNTDIDNLMQEITQFLDLPEFVYDTSYVHNLKNSAIGQSFRGYRALRNILRKFNITPLIPQLAKDKVRTILGKHGGKSIDKEAYTLNERQKSLIAKHLKNDIKKLKEEFNFNTNSWKLNDYY